MGLFNEVSNSLSKKAVNSFRRKVDEYGDAGLVAGIDAVNKHLPAEIQLKNAFGLLRRDPKDGVRRILSGMGHNLINGTLGGSLDAFWNTETPCLGSITPKEARRIIEEAQGYRRAKKNLFLIEVSSRLNSGAANIPRVFNIFATEVSYSPCVISGEATKVGGASYDAVQSVEPVELSITTMDDVAGSIKKWFAAHHDAAVSRDGTVCEPAAWAVKIRIIHGTPVQKGAGTFFETVGLFRPTSMELTLSRSEDGFEEIQMTFTQLDTFMTP